MDLEKIKSFNVAPIRVEFDKRDTILYALGLGYGANPMNTEELPFVFEGPGFQAVPTIANVLAHPGFWAKEPEYQINWVKILHAEQALTIHKPMMNAGRIRGEYQVSAIEDKGAAKGALLHQEKQLYDDVSGELIATVRSSLYMRGDGGQGGFGDAPAAPKRLPEQAPDRIMDIQTSPGQALIYRLSGDWNPLHADPSIAKKAGFDVPILQGLCTKGLACRAILAGYCDNEAARLTSMFVRFSAPALPGDRVRFEFYEESKGVIAFRAVVPDRGVTVLDRCRATFKLVPTTSGES